MELLIVGGILLLLSALLFPAFYSVRERSRSATCVSNLSQLGKSFSLYCDDHNGRYPIVKGLEFVELKNPPPWCPTWMPHPYDWRSLVRHYSKSDAIFKCPSITSEEGGYLNQHTNTASYLVWDQCIPTGGGGGGGVNPCPTPDVPPDPPSTPYVYNTMLMRDEAWINTKDFKPGHGFVMPKLEISPCPNPVGATQGIIVYQTPVSVASVREPAGVILLAESSKKGKAPGIANVLIDAELDYTEGKPITPIDKPQGSVTISRQHYGGFNALFADGHVKWIVHGTSKPSQWTIQRD